VVSRRNSAGALSQYPLLLPLNDEHQNLRFIAELLIEDVVQTRDVEETFYRQCYCDSGALAQHSLISHNIFRARYAALFDPAENQPLLNPVSNKKGIALTKDVIAEALTRRPIVLIGDVGVGKTSFLKHLRYVTAAEQFADSIYVHIDLASQAALSADLTDFVLLEIETHLRKQYGIDISTENLVRGVYALDIKRFEQGIFQALKESDPAAFQTRLLEFLYDKVKRRDEHLRNCIDHISKGRKKQFIVMIDNADQRSLEIQQRGFVIAQNLAHQWNALVFVALRPQTFYYSKRAGVLSAYS
jgi:GTPase SAR1 family protein